MSCISTSLGLPIAPSANPIRGERTSQRVPSPGSASIGIRLPASPPRKGREPMAKTTSPIVSGSATEKLRRRRPVSHMASASTAHQGAPVPHNRSPWCVRRSQLLCPPAHGAEHLDDDRSPGHFRCVRSRRRAADPEEELVPVVRRFSDELSLDDLDYGEVESASLPSIPDGAMARSLSARRSAGVRPLTRSVNASPADLESGARSSFFVPGPANGVRQEEDFATVYGYPPQDRWSHG